MTVFSNFLKKREDREIRENRENSPHPQEHEHPYPRIALPPKTDGSVAVYFASPHDVPVNHRTALTGFDSASTYLTEKEIKVLELKADAFSDIILATKFRPYELDMVGIDVLTSQLDHASYAKLRLSKSRYGQVLNLAVKTIQEFKHQNIDGDKENGKSKWRRLF